MAFDESGGVGGTSKKKSTVAVWQGSSNNAQSNKGIRYAPKMAQTYQPKQQQPAQKKPNIFQRAINNLNRYGMNTNVMSPNVDLTAFNQTPEQLRNELQKGGGEKGFNLNSFWNLLNPNRNYKPIPAFAQKYANDYPGMSILERDAKTTKPKSKYTLEEMRNMLTIPRRWYPNTPMSFNQPVSSGNNGAGNAATNYFGAGYSDYYDYYGGGYPTYSYPSYDDITTWYNNMVSWSINQPKGG